MHQESGLHTICIVRQKEEKFNDHVCCCKWSKGNAIRSTVRVLTNVIDELSTHLRLKKGIHQNLGLSK